MEMPLVSIFMPVYNGARFLNDSIDSVLGQHYKNIELLCVDDSSTDNSWEILLDYAKTDNRVRVFKKTNGGNVPKSFNYIIPFIKDGFYLYMSQDDKISPDLIENAIEKYRQTGSEVIVPTCIFQGGQNEDGHIIRLKTNTTITGKQAFLLSLRGQIHGFCLVHTSLIKDERLNEDIFNSDEFLTRRFFFKAKHVSQCEGIFAYNRGNPNSITKSPQPYRVQSLLNNQEIYDYIKSNSDNLPSWVSHYWRKVMLNKLYWTYYYIKDNKQLWSETDSNYTTNILINSWKLTKKERFSFLPFTPKYLFKYLFLTYKLGNEQI